MGGNGVSDIDTRAGEGLGALAALKNFASVSCILLLRKATVIGRNIHFRFVSSLYVLATLTHGPDDALVSLR